MSNEYKDWERENQQDADILLKAFEDVVWMAIRYANGRHTYAPSMVRDAVKTVQSIRPDWKPRQDKTLADDKLSGFSGQCGALESDWLDDLVKEEA